MTKSSMNFHSAFLELSDKAYLVWVGEHGFLRAAFPFREDAEAWASDLRNVNPPDYDIVEIVLDKG